MDGPSRTALETAVLRAAHQLIDRPAVFEDPLSMRILGAALPKVIRAELVERRRRWSARAAVAARSRFAEEEIARAVERGVDLCVVVGAGLETFAYRNPHRDRLEVVEIDTPDMQAWKRRRLAEAGIAVPGWVTFAPADLTQNSVAVALLEADVRLDRPMIVVALGTVIFLPQHCLDTTIAFVSRLPGPSGLVLDYAIVDRLLDVDPLAEREAARRAAAAVGEPLLTFLDPVALHRQLGEAGFTEIDDLDVDGMNERFFADRTDGLRLGPSGRHVLAAWTAADAAAADYNSRP